ncbi:MAG: acyl-ACP--UDP-N-acetylglucosamine O-acyltransferase [Deltaproteobacteria bacterium]|nr:acyl-ACP--UDP-N-acetylglucosamine O-acyltransferase [Candidatus Zymogenaceae bacterium]
MTNEIHHTAIVSPEAKLGDGVKIGPYAIVGEGVTLGDHVSIAAHAVVEGNTEIGDNTAISPFASVGSPPQDSKGMGDNGRLVIGSNNIIREAVTVNTGTKKGGGLTIIGDGNMLMAYSHVAHDCHIGNNNTFANVVTLAGHVEVEDFVVIGGLVAVHQFVRIGRNSFIGGGIVTQKDIPPYIRVIQAKERGARPMGLNTIGLKRRGFTEETMLALKRAYKIVWRSGLRVGDALQKMEETLFHIEEVKRFADFIRASERGIVR